MQIPANNDRNPRLSPPKPVNAAVNVVHKESHFATHVYLTVYRAAHYRTNPVASNITVHAAVTRPWFRMHYSDGYTPLNSRKKYTFLSLIHI